MILQRKNIELKDIAYYKRNVFEEDVLITLLSEFVYRSMNNNTAMFYLDNNFKLIDELNIIPKKNGNVSITDNDYFEIIETSDSRYGFLKAA